MTNVARKIFILFLCVSGLLTLGCAYNLGPTEGQVAGGKSIEINHFKNLAIEPRLSEYLMVALRRTVQQDGTFELATREDVESDYIMDGTITLFDRNGVGSTPADVSTYVDEYITITAMVTVTERATGKVILSQKFSGSTVFPIGRDQTSAERQNIPVAMDILARNIVSILADGKIKDDETEINQ